MSMLIFRVWASCARTGAAELQTRLAGGFVEKSRTEKNGE